MKDNLKLLIGGSTFTPEMDEEEQENRYFEARVNYDWNEIVDSIGTDNFKSTYQNLISEIQNLSIESKRTFCQKILEKIIEVYNYEYMPSPLLQSERDILDVYELIEFLEYDHIDFLSSLWMFLDDIQKVNLKEYCKQNIEKILTEVDSQLDSFDLNMLISIFLRTNNKENMLSFIVKKSEKSKMLIKLRILERLENGHKKNNN